MRWLSATPERIAELPGRWSLDAGGGVRVEVSDTDAPLLVGAEPHLGGAVWDGIGRPPELTSGRLRIELLARGLGRRGVRVRDPQAPGLRDFQGIEVYDYDPAWRLTGSYRPHSTSRAVTISSIVPGLQFDMPGVGQVEFEWAGEQLRLTIMEGGWLAFHDTSNGHGSTRHGRWLTVDLADPHSVVLDFNFAENPPCAFTEYGTCPLPPPGNDLPVLVAAGERDPRDD